MRLSALVNNGDTTLAFKSVKNLTQCFVLHIFHTEMDGHDTIGFGESKKNPEDVDDKRIGIALALDRAMVDARINRNVRKEIRRDFYVKHPKLHPENKHGKA